MKTKQIEVVNEVVEVVEVETLQQSIDRKKAELDTMLAEQKALKEKIKALKLEDLVTKKVEKEQKAKEKAERIQMLMLNKEVVVKENKSQKVRELLFAGKSKAEIAEATGYDNKFLLDTIWRIEKSLGLQYEKQNPY